MFRIAGIRVFLHWSWFLIAVYEVQLRAGRYDSPVFNVLEYAALFFIILLHEFGHALACRSVGGEAHEILLWPLGGVAYVSPPQRPGATLWSIAAGPLVNVGLVPLLFLILQLSRVSGIEALNTRDVQQLLSAVNVINFSLLIFNLLPIYPLDGGQIVQSLLWFIVGRGRSLQIATGIGFVGVAGLVGLAIWQQSLWFGLIAFFAFSRCRLGWLQASALIKIDKIPRRAGFACPACHAAPPIGELWTCQHCGAKFDLYLHQSTCPNCSATYNMLQCLDCRAVHPFSEWVKKQ